MAKKNRIIFEFDDAADAKEVFSSLKTKIEITWQNDTKKAMVTVWDEKQMIILVSKSITQIPKPFRI